MRSPQFNAEVLQGPPSPGYGVSALRRRKKRGTRVGTLCEQLPRGEMVHPLQTLQFLGLSSSFSASSSGRTLLCYLQKEEGAPLVLSAEHEGEAGLTVCFGGQWSLFLLLPITCSCRISGRMLDSSSFLLLPAPAVGSRPGILQR